MLAEGVFAVAREDSFATLLTQLSRSPGMRKTAKAGINELDRPALERLRGQLANVQAELRSMPAVLGDAGKRCRRPRQGAIAC